MNDQVTRARQFVDDWVTENVHPTGYEPESDASEATRLAMVCWAAADKAGIRRASIEEAVGNLAEYMAEQIEATNDAEVERLVAKED